MFLLGAAMICGAVLLFVSGMLGSAKPKTKGKKDGFDMGGEVIALLITTFLFTGGISMFLSFTRHNTSTAQYVIGAALIIGTVAIVKMLNIPSRLAASKALTTANVVSGNFGDTGSGNAPEKKYRKAA